MAEYLPIVVFGALAVAFVFLSIIVSRLLAPQRATPAKQAAYESGISDQVALPERFPVRFYLVAMLFIMFDIEIVFLYPWAVANEALGLFGLVAMLVFAGIFFLSFVYELGVGGLNWGPGKVMRRAARDPERTTTSTIRKVGLEGRPQPRPRSGEAA